MNVLDNNVPKTFLKWVSSRKQNVVVLVPLNCHMLNDLLIYKLQCYLVCGQNTRVPQWNISQCATGCSVSLWLCCIFDFTKCLSLSSPPTCHAVPFQTLSWPRQLLSSSNWLGNQWRWVVLDIELFYTRNSATGNMLLPFKKLDHAKEIIQVYHEWEGSRMSSTDSGDCQMLVWWGKT